jgi:hypothetical protein
MLRRGLNGYHWSSDDQAAFSSWSKYVLLCYGCAAAAIVIVVLAIEFFGHSYVVNVDHAEAVSGTLSPSSEARSLAP